MCIAVVDSGANLRAFVRMDDAWVGSIDISIKKAKTACFFTMGSGELGKLSQPGKPLYGIEHSNGGLITFPGGLPIIQNGELFGAIGVSGSSVENDPQGRRCGLQGLGREPTGRPSLRAHDASWRLRPTAGGDPAKPALPGRALALLQVTSRNPQRADRRPSQRPRSAQLIQKKAKPRSLPLAARPISPRDMLPLQCNIESPSDSAMQHYKIKSDGRADSCCTISMS
jgi:uncharacterized protein GlcG (DUF336 family)